MKKCLGFLASDFSEMPTVNKGTHAIKTNGVKLPVKGNDKPSKTPVRRLAIYLCCRVSSIIGYKINKKKPLGMRRA
jgi:hypothetical protein